MAHFLFPQNGMKQDPLHIGEMLEPGIRSMGYELVGVEYHGSGKGGGLLRVYIDSEQGISADDCQRVSYQVSGVLDVEDPIPGHYTLEVSSPGLDRRLRTLAHFQAALGTDINLELKRPIDGRKRFRGRLTAADADRIEMNVDGQTWTLPLAEVRIARLVPTD